MHSQLFFLLNNKFFLSYNLNSQTFVKSEIVKDLRFRFHKMRNNRKLLMTEIHSLCIKHLQKIAEYRQ